MGNDATVSVHTESFRCLYNGFTSSTCDRYRLLPCRLVVSVFYISQKSSDAREAGPERIINSCFCFVKEVTNFHYFVHKVFLH